VDDKDSHGRPSMMATGRKDSLRMGIYAKNVAIWGQNRNTNGNNQLVFLFSIRGADDNVL
jgi:hypothetical protein